MKRAFACVVIAALSGCASLAHGTVPSARAINAIEGGYAMLLDIKGGGVAPIDVLNVGPQVKVRNIACTAVDVSTATCTYDADRCLPAESDPDGDGWCHRTARYIRIHRPSDPSHVATISDGWTVDRPR